MTVTAHRLEEIYAHTDDPWGFATSKYEQAKFRETRAALSRDGYTSALELGCGNGQLARHLAPLCDAYVGLDAVEKALTAARRDVPGARFVQGFYPCPLPEGDHDLVVVSEFLYFLSAPQIATLAKEIAHNWPDAEIICVTYLGETGHVLQGEEALRTFIAAAGAGLNFENRKHTEHYRIDRGLPEVAQ